VECRQNVSVEKVSLVDDIFEVTTSVGMFSVRAVIDATGRWSKLRPALRPNGNGQSWIGLKAHFRSTGKMSNDYTTDLYFFEGGYCGVQPLGGGLVNVCAMVRTGAARQIADVFPLHPALQSRSTDWTPATESYAVAPLTFSPPVPAQNGILRAGDAASFIDPFVGDGISLALRSGTLAGDAVSRVWRNNVTCAQAAQIYENEYKARFSRALRTARSLRKLLSGPVATRRISVLLMRVPGVPQYVVRHTR
jgi:flavin-dependent dehydrogenase